MNKWFSSSLSSVQWLFFIFANTVVVPISVANAFQLPADTTAMMLRASLILTGLACIFQAWQGHRFPLLEGHSGLLWGLILNLGLSASSLGLSLPTIGGGIATGLLLASGVTIILALFNGVSLLQKIFSPMVMTVYLFLLAFQLALIFFKGMLKITEQGTIDIPVSLFSVCIVIFVSILKIKGNKTISNFSILIGLIIGWIVYELIFIHNVEQVAHVAGFSFTLFPLGKPNLEFGIIAVAFFAGMLNLSNTVSSINEGQKLFQRKTTKKEYRNSIFVTSIFTVIGTGFGLVPYTPFSSTIGFLQSTRILERKPFFIGGAMLSMIGIIPVLGPLLATMPVTVGNAVLFVAYMQLLGTAFGSLDGKTFNSNTIFRIAAPILVGVCLMSISPSLVANLPVLIQPFITNGLIMGILISIVLEKIVNWSALEKTE